MEQAAAHLKVSVRTVQRWVASSKLETEERDGRTLVLVESPAVAGEAIAQLQRQADDTTRVAALAAVTGERAALAYQHRGEELERRMLDVRQAARGWRWTAVATSMAFVATLVALSWTLATAAATRDTLADTRTQLERAESARDRWESRIAGVTPRDMVTLDVGDELALSPFIARP